ncbi:MAG TPA: hypothetical protein VMW69_17140 [Spirochaetia bacterium]|nr:hypothetical protein [Spirochaetia bacterium]
MVRSVSVILLALAVLIFAVGCSRKQSASRPRSVSAAGASAGVTGNSPVSSKPGTASSQAGLIHLNPVTPGERGSAGVPKEPRASGTVSLSGTDRLLAMQGGSAVFPSDFEIGELQPEAAAGTSQGEILRVIDSFFAGLAKGTLNDALLSPKWKDDLIRQLSYPEKRGELPTSVRVGSLRVEQGTAQAAIRMEKGDGRAVGEIYLERVNERWYISDIQADFGQLEVPFTRAQPFDPAEWKSMMKE